MIFPQLTSEQFYEPTVSLSPKTQPTLMRILSILLTLALFSCKKPATAPTENSAPTSPAPTSLANQYPNLKKPKNIVFLIGDGMALPQITAAMYMNGNKLQLERFPVTGAQKTHAKDNLITDSAAAGTAMACGTKTENGIVGCFSNGKPAVSLLELAEKQGLATGLTVTSSITHATPACYYAHVTSRAQMELIAADFMKTEIDLFIGGGKKHFADRADGRVLTKELEAKGYNLQDFRKTDLKTFVPDFSRPLGFFTAEGEPESVVKGRDYLQNASKLTVEFLKKRSAKGFFCMIEGSQIDWAAHDHDLDLMIAETLDFDRSVGTILDWAEADGETLVVVTGDHETGGLSINQQSKMGGPFKVSWSTAGHTGVMVPVFAAGPGAELFNGIYDNTAIFAKMRFLLGL